MQFISFDSHKKYTYASVEKFTGGVIKEERIEHRRGDLGAFLCKWDAGSPVAVETIGNWYWIIDEIEKAGMEPRLVHARKAKLMMGMINKTDKLDARGMNRLQRNGTLPTVWIPSTDLRDRRDLARTRMVLTQMRTRLKNRIHATLAKYALSVEGVSDAFGVAGRQEMARQIPNLPEHTRHTVELLLNDVDVIQGQIDQLDERIEAVFEKTPEIEWLMSMPGVGLVFAVVIWNEVGDVSRFPGAANLASYAGTTPRVHASGGKMRFGKLRPDVNRYLKWAFVEAANVICMNRDRWPQRHVSQLYNRIASRKGYHTAIGAVARHLAEATYWVLSKKEVYKEPNRQPVVSTEK